MLKNNRHPARTTRHPHTAERPQAKGMRWVRSAGNKASEKLKW